VAALTVNGPVQEGGHEGAYRSKALLSATDVRVYGQIVIMAYGTDTLPRRVLLQILDKIGQVVQ